MEAAELIRALDLGSEEILYHPTRGNAGDSLISLATFQHFRNVGIRYRLWNDEDDCRGRIVVLGGGGNFSDRYYSGTAQRIARIQALAKRCILLPHSIDGYAELLGSLGSHTTIVCREPVSFAHVQRHAPQVQCLLAHDLALGLDIADAGHCPLSLVLGGLLSRLLHPGARRNNAPFLFWSPLKRWRTLLRLQMRLTYHSGPMPCFRTDSESIRGPVPPGNFDFSRLFAFGSQNERRAAYAGFTLLDALTRCDRVQTDRLHIAIACGLLGKEVDLYPNGYFKNTAIYWYSMHERWPHVHWHGDAAPTVSPAIP